MKTYIIPATEIYELNTQTKEEKLIYSGTTEECEKYIHDKIEALLDVDYRMDGNTQVITAENGCEYWIAEPEPDEWDYI